MRQIKFRTYLKDTNEMVKVGAMDQDENENLICLKTTYEWVIKGR